MIVLRDAQLAVFSQSQNLLNQFAEQALCDAKHIDN